MKNKKIKLLNDGFVCLIDSMGDDQRIVDAARVSTGVSSSSETRNQELIRYLMRHGHTSPFEQVEFTFHIKVPIFIARQWLRHRTASVNEISGRYSKLSEDFYIPENFKTQNKVNLQGSDELIDYQLNTDIIDKVKNHFKNSYSLYEEMRNAGISNEMSRIVLPVSLYTEFYWKIDLHNLFHFLKLRMDSHAQEEIRLYANAMFDIIKNKLPVACKAFEDYVLNAKTFSAQEMNYVTNVNPDIVKYDLSKLEKTEFFDKILLS